MAIENFRQELLRHFDQFERTLATESGDWVVKGFIDVYRNIYTISVDTKVVSLPESGAVLGMAAPLGERIEEHYA